MAAGTRPDWENVGMEFNKDAIKVMKKFIEGVKAAPVEERCRALMAIFPACVKPITDALPEVLADKEVKDDLLHRFKEADNIYIEVVGEDKVGHGYDVSFSDKTPYIEFKEKKRGKDQFGIRFLLKDLIKVFEERIEEGRMTMADFLDFYSRGKLQLITIEQRAKWTGMSLFGGLMFYGPQIRAVMLRNKKGNGVFDQLN
ncbi:MAG TPA: hypothetical protein VMU10_02660 [Desulfomonilia bacterium]|nr:hypothetical protein [Desulfomonilia bacterium]